MNSAEAELESFRQKWREEVNAKQKGRAVPSQPAQASSSTSQAPKNNAPEASARPRDYRRDDSVEEIDEVEPHTYHELGEKQHGRRLDETASAYASSSKEPKSALEHYERAVEKESQGILGDSLNLYRKAFKLDSRVHEQYKAKHFPPSAFAPKPTPVDPNPSNAPVTVPNTAHHSLHGLSSSVQSLIQDFSSLRIEGEPPPTDLSPALPCHIASIPEELLAEILVWIGIEDVASFARLAIVCKRFAYLIMTEDRVWKRVALGPEFGFRAMHYDWACRVDGSALGDNGEGGYMLGEDDSSSEEAHALEPSLLTDLLVPSVYRTYRDLFRRRPRIRFNGVYISTVNYTRPGASAPTSMTWNSPIHIVTYYRYLRFLRDGTVISLLTTSEPSDVVPYLHMEHVHKNHGSLPSALMKDSMLGRWRLSGPQILDVEGQKNGEEEGTLHVETPGATPKYLYRMALSLGSAGRNARNNKLAWLGYWSYNKLTDDWAEFGLKNDRAFYWSRVKSWPIGL